MKNLWDRVCKYGENGLSEETVNEVLGLIEKQLPLKIIENGYGVYFCPVCKGSVWQNKDESNYCFRCGQKIKWD